MRCLPGSVEVVAVVGTGIIGASWSALFLAAGKDVDVYDPSPSAETETRAYIEQAWASLEALDLVKTSAAADRIRFKASAAAAVSRAQFVQESVPERLPIKLEAYRQMEPSLQPDAVVASSSSGLLLKEMQQRWSDPGRFLLGHPFNPPHLIPLVELLGNERTADGVLDWTQRFYESCGKTTIRVKKEVPAHVANRLQAALWREAVHLVAEGVATVEDIDKAVTAGPGLRWSVMGPHMLFSLGSGGLGMEGFCERYGDSIEAWWKTMGTPALTTEIASMLGEGVADAQGRRTFSELASERDHKLIEVIKALRNSEN